MPPISVSEARERLGLNGPSPEQRARIELEAYNRSRRYKVVIIGGIIPPPPKTKSKKKPRKHKRDKWFTGKHGPVITTNPDQPTKTVRIEQPRYATRELRKEVYLRDAGQCQYCGIEVSYEECNIDHVIPWPEGATTIDNLVVACQPCNKLKLKQWIPIHLRPIPGEVTAK